MTYTVTGGALNSAQSKSNLHAFFLWVFGKDGWEC